ncbi:MAG: LysR substrate-binding domain-containing protein [Pseudomonadota bacterium]|nr:LysR substrate-binding domain-containing protein [Pseudomonadota bacterium]
MRTINLDELEIFRCVAREGGVLRAASQLHRVPSNVTTRIKQLEQRLGVALFHRQGRALVLTEPGQTLLTHAERLLHLAAEAEQDVRDGAMRGTLRLGALESAAAARLPPVLAAFHARHPDVRVELCTGATDVLLGQLRRFAVDAVFVSEPFEPGALATRPVFREELVLITPANMHAPRGAAALNGCTLVAFGHGCAYRRRALQWLSSEGAAPARMLELASYHAIVACVAAGTGVAVVPAQVLAHATWGSSVRRHRLPPRMRVSLTHLAWHGQPGTALQALMAMLPAPPPSPHASP